MAGGPSAPPVRVVLVEYFVMEDRTLVFGVTSEAAEPDVMAVAISRTEIEDLAEGLRDALRTDHREVRAWLRDERLTRLVAPVIRWACPGDMVYLVPHDALHRVPLHAVAVEGRPLIGRNPVAVTSSASVLRYCQERRKGRRDVALIVADPHAARPLVFAREQARAVTAGFGRHEVLAGHDASRTALLARLDAGERSPDILHFTAHGVFDPDEPMRSGIDLVDGRLTAQDILGLSLDVDLVTLGACETGVSDRRPGDELIGLARALLYAGAPSVLVTLWRVDELSTSMLFAIFYAELAGGRSKAEALRHAQLRLRELTVADALDYARQAAARVGDDTVAEMTLVGEEARLLFRAGDPISAVRLLTEIAERPGLAPEFRTDLERLRSQIRMSDPDEGAGPDLLLFDDPYYWAPFVLVGDWR